MTREEFMDIVYSELHSDSDNYRANRIIDAADEYAEDRNSKKSNKRKIEARRWKRRYLDLKKQTRWIPVSERLPEKMYGFWLQSYKEVVGMLKQCE